MNNSFWSDWRPGILVKSQIEELFKQEIIRGSCNDIDNASLDLHLSVNGWLMKGSVKLRHDEPFASVMNSETYIDSDLHLRNTPAILQPKKTYIIQLQEELSNIPPLLRLHGRATGSSSIGRLDVLTRLIIDGCDTYDSFPDTLDRASLYLEITPITFPIKVQQGDTLSQLRLFRGDPELSKISKEAVKLTGDLVNTGRSDPRELTLDITEVDIGGESAVAFTTLKEAYSDDEAIDLSKPKHYDPTRYWKPVTSAKSDSLLIKKDYFYILRSKERFKLPHDVAVYCEAITENLGEIRIHYAGFVHPMFGLNRADSKDGTPLIFEVRGHTVDSFLRDGELMARVEYYRTSKPASSSETSYNKQELKLSNYFKPWQNSE